MLITDDPLLIEVAQRNYDKFPVPTNLTTSSKTQCYYTQADKAGLDVRTSVNKIGEIINLSQQLNSLLWDKVAKGASIDSCMELYYDICKLSVLSGVEIDKAKREFDINSVAEINILKRKYKITESEKTVKPLFFRMITTENGYELSENTQYRYFHTSMDYLQKILSRFNFREGRECKRQVVPFMEMVKKPSNDVRQGYYYTQRDRIIKVIRAAKEERQKLFRDYDNLSREQKADVWRAAGDIKQECIMEVEKMSSCPATMYLVLRDLDSKESRDVARFVFEVLFGRPDEAFFTMIKDSREDVYTLAEDEDGDMEFYGFKFKKVPVQHSSAA